jgi:thioester reductase-like protein
VNGTNETIRLACSGRSKILNHISTTFIFGWSVKKVLLERDANSAMDLLDFGYSQSKWVSEQLVAKAMSHGLNARIFRPALIAPSVQGGGYNFDISIRLIAFMLKHGIGTSAKNQVSFVPADLAANNIVAISNINESLGLTFHVTRDEYSNMMDITEMLGRLSEKSFVNYSLYDFIPEVVNRCRKDDLLFPLLNFLVRSIDNIQSMEFKRYDNSNYQKYRGQSRWGKEDPCLEDVVIGILRFMERQGIVVKSHIKESHV